MDPGFLNVFNWGFLVSFASASTAVMAIANTMRQWAGWEPRWAALGSAVALSFYAAGSADNRWDFWRVLVVLAHGVLLCCFSVGLQATAVGAKQRFAGVAAKKEGWWASWF